MLMLLPYQLLCGSDVHGNEREKNSEFKKTRRKTAETVALIGRINRHPWPHTTKRHAGF